MYLRLSGEAYEETKFRYVSAGRYCDVDEAEVCVIAKGKRVTHAESAYRSKRSSVVNV